MVLLFDTDQTMIGNWRFPFYCYTRALGRNPAIQKDHNMRKKGLACVNILMPCVLCLLYSWISAEQTIKLCSNTIVCSSPRTTVFQTLPFFRPVSVQTVSWFGWSWQAEFKPHYLAKKEVSSLLVLVTGSEYFMQITRSDEQLNWGLSTSIWNISAALSLPWASFVLCLVRGPGIASVFAQNIPCSPLSSCFWDALTMFMWRNSILAWACGFDCMSQLFSSCW